MISFFADVRLDLRPASAAVDELNNAMFRYPVIFNRLLFYL
ncbi:hypothetical protein IFVP22_C1280044 [Vibrio parahaemolyticus]